LVFGLRCERKHLQTSPAAARVLPRTATIYTPWATKTCHFWTLTPTFLGEFLHLLFKVARFYGPRCTMIKAFVEHEINLSTYSANWSMRVCTIMQRYWVPWEHSADRWTQQFLRPRILSFWNGRHSRAVSSHYWRPGIGARETRSTSQL